MSSVTGLLLLVGSLQVQAVGAETPSVYFERGQTLPKFLEGVKAQRALWIRNAAQASPPRSLVERLKRVSAGLRLLIVAEDWCPDSVNTVPYIVKLASLAEVESRIVNRRAGQPIMKRHRASDGRTVTPLVVLLRSGDEVGAWVERPVELQKLFLSLRAHPEMGQRFADRQSWYDADRGRTTLTELVALAEQTAPSGNK